MNWVEIDVGDAAADADHRLDPNGTARVVQCAPKVALALGYDAEAALE